VTVTITAEQRDALYDQILDRLSGIGDIEVAIEKGEATGEFGGAYRIGREYSDDLTLLLDDLGLGVSTSAPAVLNSPPDLLRRAFARLRVVAESHSVALQPALEQVRELEDRNRLVREACTSVLNELGPPEAETQPGATKEGGERGEGQER